MIKLFLPAVTGLEEEGRGSAPCGKNLREREKRSDGKVGCERERGRGERDRFWERKIEGNRGEQRERGIKVKVNRGEQRGTEGEGNKGKGK